MLGTETAAGDAGRITRDVLAGYGMAAESALHHWHPIEERCETLDVPMPQTKAERQADHQRLVDAEAAESLAAAIAQWEADRSASSLVQRILWDGSGGLKNDTVLTVPGRLNPTANPTVSSHV
jgi:hypothetical protein